MYDLGLLCLVLLLFKNGEQPEADVLEELLAFSADTDSVLCVRVLFCQLLH